MKCDYCNKDAVGTTKYSSYCKEHRDNAIKDMKKEQ